MAPARRVFPSTARTLATKTADSGQWVTVGAREGKDGKRTGGTPVFIQGGKITKGPAKLTGRRIDRMKEEGEAGSHRQQLTASKAHARAVWRKTARREGLDPDALDSLANDMQAHHQAHVEQRQALLKRARQQLAHYGYDARALTTNLRSGRVEDADSVPGLDVVADSLASSYPDHFAGRTSAAEQLLDMFTEGVPPPMDADRAYAEALEHLRTYGSSADDEREPWDSDEPIPLSTIAIPSKGAHIVRTATQPRRRPPLRYLATLDEGGDYFQQAKALLADVVGVHLPPDTDPENGWEHLVIALHAMQGRKDQQPADQPGGLPPADPVMMSTISGKSWIADRAASVSRSDANRRGWGDDVAARAAAVSKR